MHHKSIKRKTSKKSVKRNPKSTKRSPKKSVKRSAKRSFKKMLHLSVRSRIANAARRVKKVVEDELKDLDRII